MTQREAQILHLIEGNPMISQQQLAQALGITRSSVAVHISNLMRKGDIAGKGYVLAKQRYAVVVGGVNVDIGGRSSAPLVPGDSNPGAVKVSLGGVGRNIAHNMRLLGLDVKLLTAYGDDLNGQRFVSSSAELGLDISRALEVKGMPTSTYLYLTDPCGEMVLAVSDMTVCEKITPEYLSACLPVLQGAQAVVVDANIPQEALCYLAQHCTAPIFADPVSTAKAGKLLPILSRVHTLKPNALETELLTGIRPDTDEALSQAARALLAQGVKQVFLSLGERGIYAADREQQLLLPTLPGKMVNTTGCGDAALAALVWAHMEGLDLRDTALAALAAGAITMESPQTIHPDLTPAAIVARFP